jgi:beta-glucosidase
LESFERLHLDAGEKKHVTFHLDPRALSEVDDKGVRAVVPGRYLVFVGGSQPDGDAAQGVRSREFTVTGTQEIPR